MWCETYFQILNDNLKLNATRRDRIHAAVARFTEFCRNDEQLSVAMDGEPFLQGSVASRTEIRPINSDEHDVDVVYPFKLSVFSGKPNPEGVINWFLERLGISDFYKERLIPKDRCARIDYAGDFHIDLIPATRELDDRQPYAVPARDHHKWVTTDPLGFVDWIANKDQQATGIDADGVGRFVRSVRIAKRWRDRKCGADSAPTSILLATMLGKHEPSHGHYAPPLEPRLYPENPFMAAYLYDMLRLTHSCIGMGGSSTFQHPTLQEDLGKGWQHQHLDTFRGRLQRCIDHIRAGIDAETEPDAINSYREAFGEFPE